MKLRGATLVRDDGTEIGGRTVAFSRLGVREWRHRYLTWREMTGLDGPGRRS